MKAGRPERKEEKVWEGVVEDERCIGLTIVQRLMSLDGRRSQVIAPSPER